MHANVVSALLMADQAFPQGPDSAIAKRRDYPSPRVIDELACDRWLAQRSGAPQQAFSFLRIAAQEAGQLDEHLSLCGQGGCVARVEFERVVDLASRTSEIV